MQLCDLWFLHELARGAAEPLAAAAERQASRAGVELDEMAVVRAARA